MEITIKIDKTSNMGSYPSLSKVISLPKTARRYWKDRILTGVAENELRLCNLVTNSRPKSIRQFDQIPMRAADLIKQTHLIAPYFAGKSIVFIGDHDCQSLMLAFLGAKLGLETPSKMLLLDFDERLLSFVDSFAQKHGLANLIEVGLYNVFDQLPLKIEGKFDVFHTNPPYGSRNKGMSSVLFIARGIESVKHEGGLGCLILPHDRERLWTLQATFTIQRFLNQQGWVIDEKLMELHQYYLDDDIELTSSCQLISQVQKPQENLKSFNKRAVNFLEIPEFYGRGVSEPYPRFINKDGSLDFDWTKA